MSEQGQRTALREGERRWWRWLPVMWLGVGLVSLHNGDTLIAVLCIPVVLLLWLNTRHLWRA